MHLPRFTLVAILLAEAVLAGCSCPSGCRLPCTPAAPCCCQPTLVDAGPPDVAALTPLCGDEACQLQPLPTPTETFCPLDPFVCQCNAATNANLANLVQLEQHWATTIIECDSKIVQQNLCLNRDLLVLHEYDLRSEAAAKAMEAFYQLAALEAREHYLDLAINETQQTLTRIDQLRGEGLPAKIDRSEASISLHTLEDQRLQVQFVRLQLNGQLQKLLACPSDEYSFIWPTVNWTPDLTPLDVPQEVAQGLASRSDVRGLQLVLCKLEKSTLRVARGVLQVADSTIGSVEPTDGWIHKLRCIRCSDHEVDVRCKQLALLHADTEELAKADLKNAAYKVAFQQQRVLQARKAVEDRRKALHEMTAKRDVEETSIFEISRERGRVYDAESDLIQQTANLKIARVKLRMAQGMLGRECGFEPRLCCEGCCDGACMRCR